MSQLTYPKTNLSPLTIKALVIIYKRLEENYLRINHKILIFVGVVIN